MTEAIDDIARCVEDLRKGRVEWTDPLLRYSDIRIDVSTVVDITRIYDRNLASEKPLELYAATVLPPWEIVLFAYRNRHANTVLAEAMVQDLKDPAEAARVEQWQPEGVDHTIDWSQTRWVMNMALFVGGRSLGKDGGATFDLPTGPIQAWRLAVTEEGTIQDISWATQKLDPDQFLPELATILSALDFLALRNVTLVEPQRERHQRRRLARAAPETRFTEIHITPIGKSYRYDRTNEDGSAIPLHKVRGHVKRFGPKYGRKLLFGKLEGRFFVPAHARGSTEHGEIRQKVSLEP